MRLPNGYGSVYKLSGKRRNPWAVNITIGFTEEGQQVRKMLGYFKTRPEALQALSEYHNNPYDIDSAKATVEEIYEKWKSLTFNDETGESTIRNTRAAFNQLKPIHNIPIRELKLSQMQSVLNNCKNGYQSQRKIKQLLNRLYEFCIDNRILRDNPTGRLKIAVKSSETAHKRERISDKVIEQIWAISDTSAAQLALMLIYSGVRVSELLNLRKEDVHLNDRYFEVKASKTESGIRTVPIAEKVFPFWKQFVENSPCPYAVYTTQGKHIIYDNFAKHYWKPLMEKVKADNVIHETRHTCITLLTLADVNPTIIKNIVGHKSAMSLTERVYTHIDVKPLIDAINKI